MNIVCLKWGKINNVIFQKNYLQFRYGNIHIQFFIDYIKLGGANIKFISENNKVFHSSDNSHNLFFSILINGNQVIIDYSDHYYTNGYKKYKDIPWFKFHYYNDVHDKIKNVFPLGPILVYGPKRFSLNEYFLIRKKFEYIPGDSILNMQKPGGLALERRRNVQNILKGSIKSLKTNSNLSQKEFWNEHRKCLAAVCVPGANNDMLDRGQYELMGLGVCTISPVIKTVLPWNRELIIGEHYISCKDDYSDLVEIIEWCNKNKKECKIIGDNIKNVFNSVSVPKKYFKWIVIKTERFYKGKS